MIKIKNGFKFEMFRLIKMIKFDKKEPYPLLFLAISLLLFIYAPKQGGFWWSDASRHAMDGAFFYEFFKDLPLFRPIAYAVDFYL